jgi:hypothetical protein
MSPREAAQTDPMQRLALITAYEALEMAGYVPNRTPSTRLDRIGTFYGQTSDDWREINEAQDIDTYFITGGVRAFGPVSSLSGAIYGTKLNDNVGTYQLSLQVQRSEFQYRYSLFVKYGGHPVSVYLAMGW